MSTVSIHRIPQAARDEGIDLQVIKLQEAKKGFVFGWLNRFRRLARDYERLPETLAGLHFVRYSRTAAIN